MAAQTGVFVDNGHVRLVPESGKQIITEAALIDKLATKTHSGYANSERIVESRSLNTTDATVTTIFTRAVPLSSILAVQAFVVGKKNGANADGIVSFKYQAVTNNAGTVAVVGTTGGSDLENASGTPAVTIVANDTTDSIEVKVAGIAAETWSWVAHIESVIVTTSA
jgi:hypothetical protein